MTYKKIAPGIYIPATQTPEVIHLSDLEAELAALQAQAKMQEPTDQELIAFARSSHPFYMLEAEKQFRISALETLINELKSL